MHPGGEGSKRCFDGVQPVGLEGTAQCEDFFYKYSCSRYEAIWYEELVDLMIWN